MQASFKCYHAYEIPSIWYLVEPYVKQALDRGSNETLQQTYNDLLTSHNQLWTWNMTAVMVTTIQKKNCVLLTFAGDSLESMKCYNLVEQWARHEGCETMEINGRLGWSRVLGFEVIGQDDSGAYMMEKSIKDD